MKFDSLHSTLATALAAIALAAAPVALADTRVEESFDLSADGELEIVNVQGSIQVRGWNQARVHVLAELEGDREDLRITHDGRHGMIKVEVREKWFGSKEADDADLVVDVPRGVRLRISAVSADVEVREHGGAQRVQSVSGDIDIDGSSRDGEIESISGDVKLRGNGATGRFEVSAVSGDAEVYEVNGDLRVSTISGDARLRIGEASEVRLESVSGDLDFQGTLRGDGRLQAKTVSGEVALRLCDRRDLAFDLESFTGSIRDRVTGRRPVEDGFGPGAELRFSEGDGTVQVRVNTMSGNIEVRDCS